MANTSLQQAAINNGQTMNAEPAKYYNANLFDGTEDFPQCYVINFRHYMAPVCYAWLGRVSRVDLCTNLGDYPLGGQCNVLLDIGVEVPSDTLGRRDAVVGDFVRAANQVEASPWYGNVRLLEQVELVVGEPLDELWLDEVDAAVARVAEQGHYLPTFGVKKMIDSSKPIAERAAYLPAKSLNAGHEIRPFLVRSFTPVALYRFAISA